MTEINSKRLYVSVRKTWLVMVLVFSLILILPAVTGTRDRVNAQEVDLGDFVRVGVGGRPLALSGAYVAVGGNSSTPFWNPASLAAMDGFNLGGMYTDRFSAGIIYQYLSGSAIYEFKDRESPVEEEEKSESGLLTGLARYNPIRGKLGLSLTRISMDIGSVSYANNPVGEWRSLWLGTVGYRFPDGSIIDGFSVGASLKRYRRQLNEDSVSGWGYDLGLLYSRDIDLGPVPVTGSVGFNLQDPGGVEMVEGDGSETEVTGVIPPYNRVGVALATRTSVPVLVSAGYDFSPTRPQINRINLGTEISFADIFHLRGGINKWVREEGIGFSLGVGVDIGFFNVNYAYLPHNLGSTHIISSDFSF